VPGELWMPKRGEDIGVSRSTVVVTTGSFPEISQTFVVDHVKGLLSSGWDVHVAARKVHHDRLGSVALDVPVYELQAPSRGNGPKRLKSALTSVGLTGVSHLKSVSVRAASYYAPSLRDLLDEIGARVVHAHFAHNGLMASMAARGRCPVIVDFHGYDVLELPRNEGWRHFARFLRGTHGIVHSSFLEKEVASQIDLPLHRVTMGVDPELFGGSERASQWPEDLTLLTVGRLARVKGHDVAIRALSDLSRRGDRSDIRLVIVGGGPERGALGELADELGVSDRVEFSGPLPPARVAGAMAGADFLLVPSLPLGGWQESFCRVAVEGLASGLAVIGTDSGGLPDTIGTGGWVVTPGDHEELAQRILDVLDSEAPTKVAERARSRAANFDIARMRSDYDEVTRSVSESWS